MLNLDNGVNEVTVTLYEYCQNLVNPYFTWELTKKGTFDQVIFYQDDHSQIPYYFNSFTISVATFSGLTQGIININPGEYVYNIYEMPDKYNLITASAVGLVETGLLILNATFSTIMSYTQSDTDVIKAYITN